MTPVCKHCGDDHGGAVTCLAQTYARYGRPPIHGRRFRFDRSDHTVTLSTASGRQYVAATLGCTC